VGQLQAVTTRQTVLPAGPRLESSVRGKFIALLKKAYRDGKLVFHGRLLALATNKAFELLIDQSVTKEWVIYCKPPFGGPEQVLKYLARYTHRVAISNIHTPPNADKLKDVFTYLALELSTEEKEAIDFRNRTLHGRRTLKATSLAAVAEETKRFDVLRTLINKAMLRLLNYDGPYMDCGDPTPPKGFSVKTLESSPVARHRTTGDPEL
jgi:hypothetical protein